MEYNNSPRYIAQSRYTSSHFCALENFLGSQVQRKHNASNYSICHELANQFGNKNRENSYLQDLSADYFEFFDKIRTFALSKTRYGHEKDLDFPASIAVFLVRASH